SAIYVASACEGSHVSVNRVTGLWDELEKARLTIVRVMGFGVDLHELDPRRVVEDNRAEILQRIAAEGAGFDAPRLRLGGKLPRRAIGVVVDAADHQRAIRIAILECDDDLVADPRPEEGAPAVARPDLGDPQPARIRAVVIARRVPVKLNLHPAVAVQIDFL